MKHQLDFEKPITELQNKLEELRKHQETHSLNISFKDEVAQIEKKIAETRKQIFSNLTAWQRVQIARAIAHHPKVLFLDEPSAGLDPQSRIAMWDAVRALREEGITVVLTTHYMEEADELCERVAIIDHGKILVQDTPAALKGSVGAQKLYELDLRSRENIPALMDQLQHLSGVVSVESTPTGVRIFAHGVEGLLSEVVHEANPYGLRDLTITETSLKDSTDSIGTIQGSLRAAHLKYHLATVNTLTPAQIARYDPSAVPSGSR